MINGTSEFFKDSASNVRFRLVAFTRAICLRKHVKTPLVCFRTWPVYVRVLTYHCQH